MTLPMQHQAASVVQLRPYQLEAREAVQEAWADPEAGHPLVILPTGCGKTLTALSMVVEVLAAGGRVVWLAHRQELLTQPYADLARVWPQFAAVAGIVQAERDDSSRQCVFASVDTIRRRARRDRILKAGPIDLLVVDEAHHSVARTQRTVIEALKAKRRLGLTATPHRADDGDLSELWQIAHAYSITRALQEGWLVAPWAAVCPVPDVSLAHLNALSDDEQGEALIRAEIVKHTVATMDAGAHLAKVLPGGGHQALIQPRGRRYFVFCASVKQSQLTAAALKEAGWKAAWAAGETPAEDRRRLLAALAAGAVEVVCCPMIFTEGTDCPAVDGIVLARACASWGTYVQCAGRGLRLFDPSWKGPGINALHPAYRGKDQCLILDLVGVTEVHDLRAAPLLIGGTRCPETDTGIHDFVRDDGGKAICRACGTTRPCFAALGPHEWADTVEGRRCKHCDRPQCLRAPDGRHGWQKLEETQICLHCGYEMKLRLGELKKPDVEDADPRWVKWVRVTHVQPETWAVDLRENGLVYIQVDRDQQAAEPYWIRKGGRKANRMSRGPVPLDEVYAWPADLIRRSERIASRDAQWRDKPASPKQVEYLEQVVADIDRDAPWARWAFDVLENARRGQDVLAGEVATELTRIRARLRALATGLVVDALDSAEAPALEAAHG